MEAQLRRDYRAAEIGSWGYSLTLDARLKEVWWAEDIKFAFEKIGRTLNTLDAHRLIRLADLDRILVWMETIVAHAGLLADMPQRDALSPRLEKPEAYLKAAIGS
jgi:predicted DsbA family dithiol-disulfide isomerase